MTFTHGSLYVYLSFYHNDDSISCLWWYTMMYGRQRISIYVFLGLAKSVKVLDHIHFKDFLSVFIILLKWSIDIHGKIPKISVIWGHALLGTKKPNVSSGITDIYWIQLRLNNRISEFIWKKLIITFLTYRLILDVCFVPLVWYTGASQANIYIYIHIGLTFLTRLISWGASGFVTGCPFGVWCVD